MNGRTVLKWEAAGAFFIIVLGTLLHFCFEWSGGFAPCALFCAVNESVWEHLKLAFWPGLFFALLEFVLWGYKAANFIVAKAVSIYLMPVAIAVFFYGYTAISGTHLLILDILIFVISVLLGQLTSYCIIKSIKNYSKFNKAALLLLAALTLAFSLLTYFAPDFELFIDPRTGEAGIPD